MISRAALEAVTSPEHLAELADAGGGIRTVQVREVVAELRRLEGLSEEQARRLGREAVISVGGHIARGGNGGRWPRRRVPETWWIPEIVVRKPSG